MVRHWDTQRQGGPPAGPKRHPEASQSRPGKAAPLPQGPFLYLRLRVTRRLERGQDAFWGMRGALTGAVGPGDGLAGPHVPAGPAVPFEPELQPLGRHRT